VSTLIASVLITDLDNTLYDWLSLWYHPFSAMLSMLVNQSGVPEDVLTREIKTVFEQRGTTEYTFLIQSLPSLQALHPGQDLVTVYRDAIDTFCEERSRRMALYPTVEETLQTLRERGCLLVGHTGSPAYAANYRTRKLGLDGLLDILYSAPDHPFPRGVSRRQVRRYDDAHYRLNHTQQRVLQPEERKPRPKGLQRILADIGARPEDCLYIGDNLFLDIQTAKDVGVASAWAKYGTICRRVEYDLLRAVTHWSNDDVERERSLREMDVKPTLVCEKSFSELLDSCTFESFRG